MKNDRTIMKECFLYPVIILDQLRFILRCSHIIKNCLAQAKTAPILYVIINDRNNGIANLLKILYLKKNIDELLHLVDIAEQITTVLTSDDLNEKEHALYELSYYKELYDEQLVYNLINICREKLDTININNAKRSLEELISNFLGSDVSIKFFSDFPTCLVKNRVLEILKCIINHLSGKCTATILLTEELAFLKKEIPVKTIIINC